MGIRRSEACGTARRSPVAPLDRDAVSPLAWDSDRDRRTDRLDYEALLSPERPARVARLGDLRHVDGRYRDRPEYLPVPMHGLRASAIGEARRADDLTARNDANARESGRVSPARTGHEEHGDEEPR